MIQRLYYHHHLNVFELCLCFFLQLSQERERAMEKECFFRVGFVHLVLFFFLMLWLFLEDSLSCLQPRHYSRIFQEKPIKCKLKKTEIDIFTVYSVTKFL